MPELPEVETTRRGVSHYIKGSHVEKVMRYTARLRYPVPRALTATLKGQRINDVQRRGKYLLLMFDGGTLIIHLGMSGSLLIVAAGSPPARHDHIDIWLDNNLGLRLHDPRRFGMVLWTRRDPLRHKLLRDLGPEPLPGGTLSDSFSGDYLYQRSRGRRVSIKQFIMDSRTVVGVGNIYASEALFVAGIHPARAAGRISLFRYRQLVEAIRRVLAEAIRSGGTTLRDFYHGKGRPGYFQQQLLVYGLQDQPCKRCRTPINLLRQGQRATYYCPGCQR